MHLFYYIKSYFDYFCQMNQQQLIMSKTKKYIIGCISTILICGGIAIGGLYYLFMYPQFHPENKAYIYIDNNDNIDSVYNKISHTGKTYIRVNMQSTPKRMCTMFLADYIEDTKNLPISLLEVFAH